MFKQVPQARRSPLLLVKLLEAFGYIEFLAFDSFDLYTASHEKQAYFMRGAQRRVTKT
jgi:hypothetical protein